MLSVIMSVNQLVVKLAVPLALHGATAGWKFNDYEVNKNS